MKTICIIIPYFGSWPPWFKYFLASCGFNKTIDWVFYSNEPLPTNHPSNVILNQIEFEEYNQLVSNRLNINFNPASPYKLCDMKPALGLIHEDILSGYDYFGFGDIDLVYGNLRKFLNADVLEHDVISNTPQRVSGHLFLLRNNYLYKTLFKKVKHWDTLISTSDHQHFDENHFSKVFIPHKNFPLFLQKFLTIFHKHQRNMLFRQNYVTPPSYASLSRKQYKWINGSNTFPTKWTWNQGKLTNNVDGDKEFIYFHFMFWKKYEWEKCNKIIHSPNDRVGDEFYITEKGVFE